MVSSARPDGLGGLLAHAERLKQRSMPTPAMLSIRTLLLSCALYLAALPCHALPGIGATEITQLANNAELITQVSQQAQQLEHELQMINDMARNTLNISAPVWSHAMDDLSALFNVVQQGKSLAFSAADIGQRFSRLFPRFSPYTDRNYAEDYTRWTNTVRDSLKTSLEAAQLQSAQFATEEHTLSELRTMARTANGRMQAIQVSNQLAHEIATQLQKLRGLMMAQMQAQNTFMAGWQAAQDASETGLRRFLDRPMRPLDDASIKKELKERGF
jgi:type IV secretion system protein TrbJ